MPRPHGMPAAALSGMNTITAQKTERRGYCPHSTLVRPDLRFAAVLGQPVQKIVVRGEGLKRQRKLEQLPGAGKLPWGGAGSAWGRCSVGGTPQRCGGGRPEAWLLTEVHGERLRDGGREWKQESGHTHPSLFRGPRSRPAGGRERGTALPLYGDTLLVSPFREGGSSPLATRGRVPGFAQRSPPSLLVFSRGPSAGGTFQEVILAKLFVPSRDSRVSLPLSRRCQRL